MDIKELLLEEHSKKRAQQIANGIINGEAPLINLVTLLIHGDMRMRQRAAWPLELIAKVKEEILYPFIPEIIENAKASIEDSYLRNVYRLLQFMNFNPELIELVYPIAFEHFSNPQNAIAIKVFAMSTCVQMAKVYPELANEIIAIIEEQYPHGSTGYRSRANRELKRLNKLID